MNILSYLYFIGIFSIKQREKIYMLMRTFHFDDLH